jgi:hypothetical protein
MLRRLCYSVIICISGILFSCDKDIISGDPSVMLDFSNDTILFDTIFTSLGSATRYFKVFNPHSRSIKISNIYLSGEDDSPYRINIDGIPGKAFNDIVMRGGDSLFVFVEVTINPLESHSPLIAEDSVVFTTNGNIQNVRLISWGQDVNILRREVFTTGTLLAGKPYLVYDSMIIDSGHVLTIDPGVRIHFYSGAGIYVAGSIKAEGTYENPIVFEGARTETIYRNIPGQWSGIRLMPGSKGNRLINTRIRNAVTGILADTLADPHREMLYLSDSHIENMTYAGLMARSSEIYAVNTMISNCGYYAVYLGREGNYRFYHCTIANYWKLTVRRKPSVLIDNRIKDSPDPAVGLSVTFGNSVIHGSMDNEIGFTRNEVIGTDIILSHCLISVQHAFYVSNPWMFSNCIADRGPEFEDPPEFNFRPGKYSPLIDAGDPETGMMHPVDFEGKSRISGSAPDIGAMERSVNE